MEGMQREIGAARYLSLDTNLRINSWNSLAGVTLTIVCRRVDLDGNMRIDRFDHVPNSDRTLKATIHDLSAGWLVGVQVFASAGAPVRGQCFVRVELVLGDSGAILSLDTLVQDYVQNSTGIAWPGSVIRSSIEGPGLRRVIVGTNPAAGVEISETVPAAVRWRLIVFAFSFASDVTVINRTPSLIIDDGANIFARVDAGASQAASLTPLYTAAPGLGFSTTAATARHIPLPDTPILSAGDRIRTLTTNIQAADDYAAPVYAVEEWIVPA